MNISLHMDNLGRAILNIMVTMETGQKKCKKQFFGNMDFLKVHLSRFLKLFSNHFYASKNSWPNFYINKPYYISRRGEFRLKHSLSILYTQQ